MALKITTLAVALTVAGISLPANTASADNNNPCFQSGYPVGSPYWTVGPNGRCEPFNTYHAENKDPVAQVQLPAVNQQLLPQKKTLKIRN